jgi:hypothetical protein
MLSNGGAGHRQNAQRKIEPARLAPGRPCRHCLGNKVAPERDKMVNWDGYVFSEKPMPTRVAPLGT